MSRTVDVGGLGKFITGTVTQVSNAFREIEQLQAAYQGAYTRFRADHDRTLAALVAQIEALPPDALGEPLRRQIAARRAVENKDIADRIAHLEQTEIPDLQHQADALIGKGQKDQADLREMNPKLNAREESLKTELAAAQKQLDDLNAQVSTQAHGVGFVLHARTISRLDAERFRVLGQIQTLAKELSKVRGEWQELNKMAGDDARKWQSQWQNQTAQLGTLQAEHDQLAQNAETLARHRAIAFVVDNLKAPLAGTPEPLAVALQPMIALNIQTDDFQAALGAVAGVLGLANGVTEGLNRLQQSVQALADEQSRHSQYLPALSFALPDTAPAFGAVWDDLAARAKDEKTLAKHPTDFVAISQPFLSDRLSQARVAAFFNELGRALTIATAKWKG